MFKDFNQVLLVGKILYDPEIKYISLNKLFVLISLIVKNYRQDNFKKAIFLDFNYYEIYFYNSLAERAVNFLRKDFRILIEGFLKSKMWIDKSNINHFNVTIIATNFYILNIKNIYAFSFNNFNILKKHIR